MLPSIYCICNASIVCLSLRCFFVVDFSLDSKQTTLNCRLVGWLVLSWFFWGIGRWLFFLELEDPGVMFLSNKARAFLQSATGNLWSVSAVYCCLWMTSLPSRVEQSLGTRILVVGSKDYRKCVKTIEHLSLLDWKWTTKWQFAFWHKDLEDLCYIWMLNSKDSLSSLVPLDFFYNWIHCARGMTQTNVVEGAKAPMILDQSIRKIYCYLRGAPCGPEWATPQL